MASGEHSFDDAHPAAGHNTVQPEPETSNSSADRVGVRRDELLSNAHDLAFVDIQGETIRTCERRRHPRLVDPPLRPAR